MTATSISTDVRGALATALATTLASVYTSVPETVIPPAVVIVPDSPYLESNIIGKDQVRVKINMTVSAAVAYNNNAGALDQLEVLIITLIGLMPVGYTVGDVSRPSIISVGASNLLSADLSISTYYTQVN